MLTRLVSFFAALTVASAALGKTVTLNNGVVMPTMAFSYFVKTADVDKTYQAVLDAYCHGVRHFDTAMLYGTEEPIGRALRYLMENGDCHGNEVTRDEIFITTKMDYGYTRALVPVSLNMSLDSLLLDYVDMYVVHLTYNPIEDEDFNVTDVWKGMEDVQKSGKVKSIGLSNHNSTHINKILMMAEIMPAVSQIEVNPTYPNLELVAYCHSKGILPVGLGAHGFLVPRPHQGSYSPPPKLDDPTLTDMANKYGKTTSQLVLRQMLDRDIVPVITAYTPAHMAENMDVYDFNLSKSDALKINDFYRGNPLHSLMSKSGLNDLTLYYFGITVEETFAAMGLE